MTDESYKKGLGTYHGEEIVYGMLIMTENIVALIVTSERNCCISYM
jgi:hypothetical protein